MSTTVTFQQGVQPDAGYAGWTDSCMLSSAPDTNYGSATTIICGWISTAESRGIFRCDLSSITPPVVVQAATIAFLESNYNDGVSDAYIQAIVANLFTELGVTWNKYDGASAWTAPGGDLAASPAQSGVTVTKNQWYTFGTGGELNGLVQGWINVPATNLGFIVHKPNAATPAVRFRCFSHNHATKANRPVLSVTYGIPWAKSVNDIEGLTDTTPKSAGFNRAVSDTEGLSDVALRVIDFIRATTDTEGLTDVALRVIDFIRAATDTEGLTDAVAEAMAFSRSVTDTEGLTDVVGRVADYVRTLANTLGLTDVVIHIASVNKFIDETMGLTDTTVVDLFGPLSPVTGSVIAVGPTGQVQLLSALVRASIGLGGASGRIVHHDG